MAAILGLDIGSNSVGSAWIDTDQRSVGVGVGVFPAGVDESDEKRGDPKNAKRRMARRARITLARRAQRKRALRLMLIGAGLLPADVVEFDGLLTNTDPWTLRRKGLDGPLTAYEFGRVLLHMAQRRGALGLKLDETNDDDAANAKKQEDGKVTAAIREVRAKMLDRNARTFGEFIAMVRDERVIAITAEDRRPVTRRNGPREYRNAIRNRAGSYEHCADRAMIQIEFGKMWTAQKNFRGETASLLTDELRRALDDESADSLWRHKGLLFGQRRQSWDLGTLGRCVLEPTERCVPHADMYASHYLVVETVNNLKIIEWGKEPRPLTSVERKKIKDYLSGPLGMEKGRKKKGQSDSPPDRPKTKVNVTDLRELMGWGRATKTTQFRFNIENDEDRQINTDWFAREIIQGAITPERWELMPDNVREGLNRAILRHDPDQEGDSAKLKAGVINWAGLSEPQADALVAGWKRRPRPDANRLNMGRSAARNILAVMDRDEPWPDTPRPGQTRWLTQIEARRVIAGNPDFKDVTTGKPLDDHARRRYATGAKGATSRDRHYMEKHVLRKNGVLILGPDGKPLAEPPPAPQISNPVVRKAIHEVRRHILEYMTKFGRKPDEVYVELAREARMGKVDADRLLFRNRLRNRIRNDIIDAFDLDTKTATQQRAAVDRVVLYAQQNGVCPLCGQDGLTARIAAYGEGCEVAHIIPRGSGGQGGLGNLVLAHTKCNRDMGRRAPRQFWESTLGGGFEEGTRWVQGIYGDVTRPKPPSKAQDAVGAGYWPCYFTKRDDNAKIEQFKKDVRAIQGMTERQEAATKYAARQVMAYIADALYDGKGLPERGGERLIYATNGLWTSRFRREWGLFFDRHGAKAKQLSQQEEHERKEKNRGDHRHHAIDAIVIALCSRNLQIAWENREKQADGDGVNTADEETLENYRRNHPLRPPPPFKTREDLREAVRNAVFGDGEIEKPVCHRPVKRKLIGELHEAFPRGPVLDCCGRLTDKFTKKISILELAPNHLRMPRPETQKEAIERLAVRRERNFGPNEKEARKWARSVVSSPGFMPAIVDPPPEKSGIVRDVSLRARLRTCLTDGGLDPDNFSTLQLRKLVEDGRVRQGSNVPIRSVVLLWTIKDPVVVSRWAIDHLTGRRYKEYDAATGVGNAATARAYIGGNQHHIEIRVDQKGEWSGRVVTAFEAAQRKIAKLRAFREAGIPKFDALRALPPAERARLAPMLRAIEKAHPLVDRSDSDEKGGRYVMSVCEGEMLLMRHKRTGEVGYFVVAKLDKPQSIVLVPHWDARAATDRKDAEGKKVPDSKRDEFSATPSDLLELAAPGHQHAVKVRVSPLGDIKVLKRD